MDGTVLDSGTVRLEFTRTGNDVHEMRATYAAGSPAPPAHLHPSQDEHFAVLEGSLLFVVDGVETLVEAGGAIDVPRGAVHQVSNPGPVAATALWQTRPALRTGEFLCAVADARATGDLGKLLEVLEEYGDVIQVVPGPG